MDPSFLSAAALAISGAGTGIEIYGFIEDLNRKRANKSINQNAGERAVTAAFFHFAGVNVAFNSISYLLDRYAVRHHNDLDFEGRRRLLGEDDNKRFECYFEDLLRYVDRLEEEQTIAAKILEKGGGTDVDQLLAELNKIEEVLRLIEERSGKIQISFLADLISEILAKTQKQIGRSLGLRISAVSLDAIEDLKTIRRLSATGRMDEVPSPTGARLAALARRASQGERQGRIGRLGNGTKMTS